MSYDIVKCTDNCYHLIALKRVTTLFLLPVESVFYILCLLILTGKLHSVEAIHLTDNTEVA
jgi:hypothetical protein